MCEHIIGVGFLAFDEVFGSQDEERRFEIMEAFHTIKEQYRQIQPNVVQGCTSHTVPKLQTVSSYCFRTLLISHESEIKEMFERVEL